MITRKHEDVPKINNPHKIDSRHLHSSEFASIIHITLQPSESLLRHITPVDVVFYVLEGEGVVKIGDEEQEVGTDTLIESPANIEHCWYNRSENVFRVLVIKTPKPTTPTKFLEER